MARITFLDKMTNKHKYHLGLGKLPLYLPSNSNQYLSDSMSDKCLLIESEQKRFEKFQAINEFKYKRVSLIENSKLFNINSPSKTRRYPRHSRSIDPLANLQIESPKVSARNSLLRARYQNDSMPNISFPKILNKSIKRNDLESESIRKSKEIFLIKL